MRIFIIVINSFCALVCAQRFGETGSWASVVAFLICLASVAVNYHDIRCLVPNCRVCNREEDSE